LLAALVVVVVLAGLAAALFTTTLSQQNEAGAIGREMKALYLAEAGVSECFSRLVASRARREPPPTRVGSVDQPLQLRGGEFWCDLAANADGTFTVTSSSRSGGGSAAVRAIIAPEPPGVFEHAIFAGNRSGDPGYTLRLSGDGAQADQVQGNVYSGGDILIEGDADVIGDVVATGSIQGIGGDEGERRPLPDIAGMGYETNHDVNIAALFSGATWESDDLGGFAWQLPESSPGHIFRKNPDDRTTETGGTVKDDYFLEDPYMPNMDWAAAGGAALEGHTITLSGAPGRPGPNGNDLVYFIDGNLWVHNKPFRHLRFQTPEGVRVTFIVKGNIYFSDDVYMGDHSRDGVAFIAINDSEVEESGNIYLGDPRYGTLEHMEAFLYAENDFYDNNLDEAGSATVTILGNMTAGNRVAIERDFVGAGGTEHSKLTVQFDDRISTGNLVLPGLPRNEDSTGCFRVVMWERVPSE
jgi:hypothetical protein